MTHTKEAVDWFWFLLSGAKGYWWWLPSLMSLPSSVPRHREHHATRTSLHTHVCVLLLHTDTVVLFLHGLCLINETLELVSYSEYRVVWRVFDRHDTQQIDAFHYKTPALVSYCRNSTQKDTNVDFRNQIRWGTLILSLFLSCLQFYPGIILSKWLCSDVLCVRVCVLNLTGW